MLRFDFAYLRALHMNCMNYLVHFVCNLCSIRFDLNETNSFSFLFFPLLILTPSIFAEFINLQNQNNSHQNSIDELCLKEEALKERDEMVSCLLEELVKVRQSVAEGEDTIRNLKTKIEELEEDKKTLRETTPDNSVAHLQEELIASKLREAEASLSLKDLKQRVQELSTQWQRQLQVCFALAFRPMEIQTTLTPLNFFCRNKKPKIPPIQHRKN